jgi:hypothetical protein
MKSSSNKTSIFFCKICETEIKTTSQNFSKHLKQHEITSKDYYDKFFKTEQCGICLTCGKETKFKSISSGYLPFCSNFCAQTHPSTLLKVKNINIQKYGVETYTQTQEYKDKIKKIRTDDWEKKRTDKINETKLESYKHKYFSEYEYLGYREAGGKYKTKEHHLKCQCGFDFWIQNQLILLRSKAKEKLCTKCNPLNNYTRPQNDFGDFLKSIVPDKTILTNCRKVFNGELELDLFIEELNIAFEFNGLFWHSEVNLDNNYHLRKTEMCQEKGIRLVHIWEDDWRDKREIVKSMVSNILSKTKTTIYARKCEIKQLNYKETLDFLNENHLQGHTNSTINYGLIYDSEIVSVMTFSPQRISVGGKKEENSYELVRFCNKLNTNVVGAASKLFSHFVKTINPVKIKSFADKSWSNGNMYSVLGFRKMQDSSPSYHYIVSNTRVNRFNFRKSVLVSQGFDINKTEHEIMLERKIYRLYDCGCLVFEWSQKEK